MKSITAISLRVNQLLIERNMTRYKLARKIAISETTLKHILDEENKSLRFDTLLLIAEGFDMSIIEFLNCDLFNKDNLEIS